MPHHSTQDFPFPKGKTFNIITIHVLQTLQHSISSPSSATSLVQNASHAPNIAAIVAPLAVILALVASSLGYFIRRHRRRRHARFSFMDPGRLSYAVLDDERGPSHAGGGGDGGGPTVAASRGIVDGDGRVPSVMNTGPMSQVNPESLTHINNIPPSSIPNPFASASSSPSSTSRGTNFCIHCIKKLMIRLRRLLRFNILIS